VHILVIFSPTIKKSGRKKTETEITVFYTACDNMLKTMNFRDDCQTRMNTAEVMTVVLTAARFFSGNTRSAACFFREHVYIPDMLSESRLNRRPHATDESAWENLFHTFADIFRAAEDGEYIIDSFPVPVCVSIRIPRSKILRGRTGGAICLPSVGIVTEHGFT
jgi:hypothetical protein